MVRTDSSGLDRAGYNSGKRIIMRSFIDKTGKVIDCTTEHIIFCRKVLHKRYGSYLQQNIRVMGFKDYMVIETHQIQITTDQLKAIRKLYREYRCLSFFAEIGTERISRINDLKNFTEIGG